MSLKIAIVNHGTRMNKGTAALLNSRINSITKLIPDSEFVVFTYVLDYEPETKYLQHKVKFYRLPLWYTFKPNEIVLSFLTLLNLVLYKIGLESNFLNEKTNLNEYKSSDIVISTGGDGLTEDYGSISFLVHVLNLFIGIFLNKKVMIYAETIGPFEKYLNKKMAIMLFNRVNLITVREKISGKILEKLGIDPKKVQVTADSAFLLEAKMPNDFNNLSINKPLIGFSVSRLISKYGFSDIPNDKDKYNKYIQATSEIIDNTIECLKCNVILIPHVIGEGINNDNTTINDTFQLIKNKSNCFLVEKEYTSEELKGIIGQCEIFIGARMHSTIASISMEIPTIAISYSNKYYGIIGKMLGYERYIISINDYDVDLTMTRIKDIWNNRYNIKKELKVKIDLIKQSAELNAELIKSLVSIN